MGLWNGIKMFCKGTVITAKVAVTSVRVAGHLVASTARGTAATVKTVSQALDKVNRKDWDGLGELVENKAEQIGRSIEAKFQLAAELEQEASACLEDKSRKFLTKQNAKRIAGVITLGSLTAGCIDAASDALDADSSSTDMVVDTDSGPVIYSIGGMTLMANNAVFDGDDDDLQKLISMGELDNTEHTESEELNRDTAARIRFLKSHGFDSVPEGYEIHHIVPVCEGGADAPENMILIEKEKHDIITAAHSKFYGWHS